MTNAEILGGRLLPMQDLSLYRLVEETCWRWATYSRYPLKRVEPLRNHSDTGSYGWYNRVSKSVNIGVRFSFQGRWRAYPHTAHNIIDSIAHELGHFQFFNHGKKHQRITYEIRQDILDEGMLVEFEKRRQWLPSEERYA